MNDPLVHRHPAFEQLRDDAEALTPLSVRFRYPGASLTLEQAKQGVSRAGRIRAASLAFLNPGTASA